MSILKYLQNSENKEGHMCLGFFFFLFFLLSLAVLGLRCCAWAFSSCSEWGLLFVALLGLLTVVGSLVAEYRI